MTLDAHTPRLDMKLGYRSQARWSTNPEGKLLVFVHGFKGDPLTTWGAFPEQLSLHKKAGGYDIVCFGYESAVQTAGESANQLQTFLNTILFDTVRIVNQNIEEYSPSLRRSNGFTYRELVLVGHSLGACIIRQAMLNQVNNQKRKWPKQTKLVWFAPAHLGAKLFRLVTSVTLGVSVGLSVGIVKYAWPVLTDLEENSRFLKRLLADTDKASKKTKSVCAPLTFWAWKDKVVVNGFFSNDTAPCTEIRGVSHISICKPAGNDGTVKKLLEVL